MKRTAEEETDKGDAFYDEIADTRAQKHAVAERYIDELCPPAPLDGIEEVFAYMEKVFRPRFLAGENLTMIACWEPNGTPIATAFQCNWWRDVVKWHSDVVWPRKETIRAHSERVKHEAFKASIQQRLDEVRTALSDGWNELHPMLPCSWANYKKNLVVRYTDDKKNEGE